MGFIARLSKPVPIRRVGLLREIERGIGSLGVRHPLFRVRRNFKTFISPGKDE